MIVPQEVRWSKCYDKLILNKFFWNLLYVPHSEDCKLINDKNPFLYILISLLLTKRHSRKRGLSDME